jgi:Dienelactone hydrolase and related enzymes
MQAMCDYADRWIGLLRLELSVYVDNDRAIALYRRFGFETEGRYRGYVLRDGVFVDAFAMARLHPAPPVIGAATASGTHDRAARGARLHPLRVVGSAAADERVSFPSLDGPGNAPVVLIGHFFAASTSPAAAIAMFHGCSGPYDRRGALAKRMREYVELFNGLGMHVLVVDSLTPRYEKELCTQRTGKRRVTQANRRLDALGAIDYLAERPDVDPKRIGLIGWSNGGSTVLAATNCATTMSPRRRPSRRSRSRSIPVAKPT